MNFGRKGNQWIVLAPEFNDNSRCYKLSALIRKNEELFLKFHTMIIMNKVYLTKKIVSY